MPDIIDEAQEREAQHIEASLRAHAASHRNTPKPVPDGTCHNPDCVEDFEAQSDRIFCGPRCADRFDAITKHRNT